MGPNPASLPPSQVISKKLCSLSDLCLIVYNIRLTPSHNAYTLAMILE
jgi:hypothetical protein